MKEPNAKLRRILGRISLRYAAFDLLKTPPKAVKIKHGQHGKPEVDNIRKKSPNLSENSAYFYIYCFTP